jgi:hypothetical protein
MHFDEFIRLEWVAGDGIALILLDEGHDVKDVKDMPLWSANWVLKGGKGESTTIEWELVKLVFFCLLLLAELGVG